MPKKKTAASQRPTKKSVTLNAADDFMPEDRPEDGPLCWLLEEIAIPVSELVRRPEVMGQFRQKLREWLEERRPSVVRRLEWDQRRNKLVQAAIERDAGQTGDDADSPGEGWAFETFPNFSDPNSRAAARRPDVGVWLPPELAKSAQPDIPAVPLPLPKRGLSLCEKYVVLAGIRDCLLKKGLEPIDPWRDLSIEAETEYGFPAAAYGVVRALVASLSRDELPQLREYFADVEEDIAKE